MLGVVDKEVIRRLHHRQGWSERRIARELGHDRATIHKYLQEGSEPPRYRLTQPRPKPVLAPVLPILERWLAEDEQQPPKQRRTAHRMWVQLRDEYGFAGGEPRIRMVVRQLKARRREVFVPLAFAPGERAEVDWGTAQVVMAGAITTVHLFCARLRYSGMPFVMACPHEQQEACFTGHRQMFAWWGGVPQAVVYDNLTTASRSPWGSRPRRAGGTRRAWRSSGNSATQRASPTRSTWCRASTPRRYDMRRRGAPGLAAQSAPTRSDFGSSSRFSLRCGRVFLPRWPHAGVAHHIAGRVR